MFFLAKQLYLYGTFHTQNKIFNSKKIKMKLKIVKIENIKHLIKNMKTQQ